MSWASDRERSYSRDRNDYDNRERGKFRRSDSRDDRQYESRNKRRQEEEQNDEEYAFDPNEEKNADALFAESQTTGIDFSKLNDLDIKCNPAFEAPRTFEEMNLDKKVMDNIEACKFTVPTPIQRFTVPLGMTNDLIATSQTGSGKTAAFTLPIINRILSEGFGSRKTLPAKPKACIIAPTRELALQINEVCRKLSYGTGIRTSICYGAAPSGPQVKSLFFGADIIVGTPGRLIDFISGKSRRYLPDGSDLFENSYSKDQVCALELSECTTFVLDEADRLLDMGFVDEINKLSDTKFSGMPPRGERRTLMFSATFPREIQRLAAEMLDSTRYHIEVGRVGVVNGSVKQTIILENSPAERRNKALELIKQRLDTPLEDDEMCEVSLSAMSYSTGAAKNLARRLDPERAKRTPKILVFMNKKHEVEAFVDLLYENHLDAVSLHGDKKQSAREAALVKFKAGLIPVMVATDVAQRGLDIPAVTMVINMEFPSNLDSYTHRVGRTARAGRRGEAVSFFTFGDRSLAKPLIKTLEESNQEVPEFLVEMSNRVRPARESNGGYQKKRFGGNDRRGGGRFDRNDRRGGRFDDRKNDRFERRDGGRRDNFKSWDN